MNKKNIIFVFTGTGNSYKMALGIAKELNDCEVVSMGNSKSYQLSGKYERIGFVYPTYYRGEPRKVREFIKNLDLDENQHAYYFAVTTCGKISCSGNALAHVKQSLKQKNIKLNYGKEIEMFSNYLILYDMDNIVSEETVRAEKALIPIIQSIKKKENKKTAKVEPLQEIAYHILIKRTANMDKKYNVSDNCTNCGICKKVCPVNNIEMSSNGKPVFKHHCEQCVACIQYCPAKAINYKNKTQNRKRYHHPNVNYKDLAKFNGY